MSRTHKEKQQKSYCLHKMYDFCCLFPLLFRLPLMDKFFIQPLLYGAFSTIHVRKTSMGSMMVFFTAPEVM